MHLHSTDDEWYYERAVFGARVRVWSDLHYAKSKNTEKSLHKWSAINSLQLLNIYSLAESIRNTSRELCVIKIFFMKCSHYYVYIHISEILGAVTLICRIDHNNNKCPPDKYSGSYKALQCTRLSLFFRPFSTIFPCFIDKLSILSIKKDQTIGKNS